MRWEYKGEKHKAATFFDSMEIHNGMSSAALVVVTFEADRPLIFVSDTKFIHFRKTKEKTNIPYEQMVSPDILQPRLSCLISVILRVYPKLTL